MKIKFLDAIVLLKEEGITVKASVLKCENGAFYEVTDLDEPEPSIWMLPQAVCSLAEALEEFR